MTSSVSVHFSLPIRVYSTSTNATVNVGGFFNFSCNATDFILRQWVFTSPFSRATVVRSTTDGRITITEDFELLVTDARFEDEGMYECQLVNNLGSIRLKNNLSVIGKDCKNWLTNTHTHKGKNTHSHTILARALQKIFYLFELDQTD